MSYRSGAINIASNHEIAATTTKKRDIELRRTKLRSANALASHACVVQWIGRCHPSSFRLWTPTKEAPRQKSGFESQRGYLCPKFVCAKLTLWCCLDISANKLRYLWPRAAVAQLAARRSHNPKVGSSILSCRICVCALCLRNGERRRDQRSRKSLRATKLVKRQAPVCWRQRPQQTPACSTNRLAAKPPRAPEGGQDGRPHVLHELAGMQGPTCSTNWRECKAPRGLRIGRNARPHVLHEAGAGAGSAGGTQQ